MSQALQDDAAFLPTLAFLFYDETGSHTPPSDQDIEDFDSERPELLAEKLGMRHLGHTDLDEDIEGEEEGGDSEVRGTRQRPNLRERVEPVVEYMTVNAVQFTRQTLDLYYGAGSTTRPGRYIAPIGRKATVCAILIIYVDQDRNLGEYIRRASVRRGGPLGREAENFLRAPLRITPLATADGGTEWINSELFGLEAPTGLTAGTPGSTTVPLSWNPVAGAASYVLQRRAEGGEWTDVSTGNGGTPNGTSTTISGLTSGRTYDFRVAAVQGGERGLWSGPVSATTA